MKAHIDAIVARLATVGHPVYFVEAPDTPSLPYYLVWSSSGALSDERDVSALSLDLDTQVGITAVAGTPGGVLLLQAAARPALLSALSVPGRAVWFTLTDSRAVQLDRDVVIPGTTSPPAYGVDLYRLQSVPA